MLLTIDHTTRYHYEAPGMYAVQRLRLTPPDTGSQSILHWTIDAPGIESAAVHTDCFGNIVHLIAQANPQSDLVITASGQAETHDTDGISGPDNTQANPRIFLNATRLTESSEGIDAIARQARDEAGTDDVVAMLHVLMRMIAESVAYDTDSTHAGTTAREAFETRRGVCQDHTHILIAAARFLEIPARYVTGYLHVDSDEGALAHHAWAEAYVPDLGWVGFDPANRVCPTEHYLRLACGFDAIGAAPITGLRKGGGDEKLTVDVTVKQQQQ